MLNVLAERVATAWAADSADPDIKVMSPRAPDWGAFLDQILAFIEKLLPLLDMCPMNPEKLRSRAAKWAPCTEMSFRQKRRKIGFLNAWMLSNFQDEFDATLGPRVSAGIDNEEFQAACLKVTSQLTDNEAGEVHAIANRVRAEV